MSIIPNALKMSICGNGVEIVTMKRNSLLMMGVVYNILLFIYYYGGGGVRV